MKTFLTLAGSVLFAAMLAACSPGINEGIGHRITFDANGMVVHAAGKPDAHVGSDGSLAIGGRTVEVTPAQRALLQHYYGEARGLMQSGAAVGKAGVKIARQAVGNAVQSIFSNKSGDADKSLDAQSSAIEKAAEALCTNVHQLAVTQKQIASQLPAFKPYDALGDTHCKTTTTYRFGTSTIPSDSATVSVTESKSAAQ
jgi:hypothetical protein